MPKKKRQPRKPIRRAPRAPHAAPTPGAGAEQLKDELDGTLPDFLGDLPDDETLEAHVAATDEDAHFLDATLMSRADAVLRQIGDGHPFTDEDGLGPTASATLLEQFGFAATDIRSTWDAPPLSALLAGLTGGGFLEMSAGQIRPAALVSAWAWPDAPPQKRTGVGRILYATTLSAFLEVTEEGSAALAPPFTAMALLAACGPQGLHLPEAGTDTDEYAVLRSRVREDLLALQDIGLVDSSTDDTFTASPVLLSVLPTVVDAVAGQPQ